MTTTAFARSMADAYAGYIATRCSGRAIQAAMNAGVLSLDEVMSDPSQWAPPPGGPEVELRQQMTPEEAEEQALLKGLSLAEVMAKREPKPKPLEQAPPVDPVTWARWGQF